MKNWRPKGWKNPHIIAIDDVDCSIEAQSFEAGANAMLEALRKVPIDGTHVLDGGTFECAISFPYKLIFVPEVNE